MRVAIAGVPRAGKTTTSSYMPGPVYHTDDLIEMGWSRASEVASHWFDDAAPELVVEGMAVPRALRKWLERNPEGAPVDVVIWLGDPHFGAGLPIEGQERMGKGAWTVLQEISGELMRRGVRFEFR